MSEAATIERREDPPLVKLIDQYRVDLEQALPEGMTPSRFQSIVINQVRENRQLLECVPMTLVASALMAAQLGLQPGGAMGECWIIPRRNQGRWEANFQLGYKGLRQLAYRSAQVRMIESRIVWEGDDFDFHHGLGGTNWKHKPTDQATDRWTYVYAAAETVLGGEAFEAMSREQVLAHRDRYVSKQKDGQWPKAWRDNEPEMARKTVTAALCRQLPMSVEFRDALAADGMTPYALAPDLAGMMSLERGSQEEVDDAD